MYYKKCILTALPFSWSFPIHKVPLTILGITFKNSLYWGLLKILTFHKNEMLKAVLFPYYFLWWSLHLTTYGTDFIIFYLWTVNVVNVALSLHM